MVQVVVAAIIVGGTAACVPDSSGQVVLRKGQSGDVELTYQTCGSVMNNVVIRDEVSGSTIVRQKDEISKSASDVNRLLGDPQRKTHDPISIGGNLENGDTVEGFSLTKGQVARIPAGWYAVGWSPDLKGRDLGSVVAIESAPTVARCS